MSHLLTQLKKNPNDVQTIIDASITYIHLCDYEGAKRMASRLETLSHNNPDSIRPQFFSRLLSGWASLMIGQAQQAADSVSLALKTAEDHDMTAWKAMAANLLGYYYVNTELDLTEGLTLFNKALANAKSTDDYKLVVAVLNNLSNASLWNGDYSGIKYAEEALRLSREHAYNYGVVTSLFNVIRLSLFNIKNLDAIPRMMSEIENLQNKNGYMPQGGLSLLKGHMAMAMGDDGRAVEIFKESLENAGYVMPAVLKIESLLYYSWALMKLQKYSEAISVCKEALALMDSTGYSRFSPFILSALAQCCENTGLYQEALFYLKDYNQRLNVLLLSEQTEALNQARIENEISLNENKISRQQSQINSRGRFITILIAVSSLLIISLVLLFILFRRKGILMRAVIQREKEAVIREKILKHSLEQLREELSNAPGASPSSSLTDDRIDNLMILFNDLMTEKKYYTDPNISIKTTAEALNTNRTYLSNSINKVFNKSFPQVLAEYRVRAAIEMLNDPECDMPLKAIAAEVGFSSPAVFYTTFRNFMGMTPTAYRNSRLQ